MYFDLFIRICLKLFFVVRFVIFVSKSRFKIQEFTEDLTWPEILGMCGAFPYNKSCVDVVQLD